jgi:hypothetical protein
MRKYIVKWKKRRYILGAENKSELKKVLYKSAKIIDSLQ